MRRQIFVSTIMLLIALVCFLLYKSLHSQNQTALNNLTKVTVGMGYIPNVQFAPFYVAQSKGYFKDQGLDVTFDYAMSPDLLKLLGQGKLDFVISTGDDVLLAVNQEIPVKYVMTLYDKFPIAVVSLKDKNITKPEDLKGKKIGLPVFSGSSYLGFKAFLATNHINESEVDMQAIGYSQVASLVEKRVDAVVVFSMNEPIQLKNQGYEINTIEFSNYVDFASAGIITNNQILSENPTLAKKFVTAVKQGMQYTKANPSDAYSVSATAAQISSDQQEVQFQVLERTIQFWGDGNINQTTWSKTAQTLKTLKLINENLDYKKAIQQL